MPSNNGVVEKKCAKCEQVKPAAAFSRMKASRDGLQRVCKECNAAVCRQWRKETGYAPETPEEAWPRALKRKYNLTQESYEAKLVEQGGGCAVCGAAPGKRRLCVDHDHACCSGERCCGKCVRGLLCDGCNMGGKITDNIDLLRRKVAYLEFWKQRLNRA